MYPSPYSTGVSSILIISVVALLLAIAGTILTYIFIMPKNKAKDLNKYLLFVRDTFQFKTLWVEHIFKAMYVFTTIFIIAYGFCMMFASFLTGLLMMVFGPIALRITYEMIMMFIILVKNVSDIRNKLCDDGTMLPADAVIPARESNTPASAPTAAPAYAPAQPAAQMQQPATPAQNHPQSAYNQYSAGYTSSYSQRPQQNYAQTGEQGVPREYRRHRTSQE